MRILITIVLLLVSIYLDVTIGLDSFQKMTSRICSPEYLATQSGIAGISCIDVNYIWNILHLIMTVITVIRFISWLNKRMVDSKEETRYCLGSIVLLLLVSPFITIIVISITWPLIFLFAFIGIIYIISRGKIEINSKINVAIEKRYICKKEL